MNPKKAVIYCRVSSSKQTTQGDGLGSQQTRCREYAKYKGYEVVQTFNDDLSGAMITRPGMKAMLSFLRKNKSNPHVVIIDDISRLARNIEAHLQLRDAISQAGGILESPTIEFGEDSDSILVENLLASVSQHQRQKNAEQTKNRMKARVMNGYWVFQAPVGYKYKAISGKGKVLVRDEPIASIIQEALEGFASGRFETQAEVKRFLEQQPAYPKDFPNGEIRNQRVSIILNRILYAGYIEAPNWNISLRKGHHEPLISLETYEKVQSHLNKKKVAPVRKDISEDFPLRGFLLCGECETPMTACWSKGKYKTYPYYWCKNKSCTCKGKSIPRDKIEGEFEQILKSLRPTRGFIATAKAMLKTAWNFRLNYFAEQTKSAEQDLKMIDRKIEQLVDRIVDANSDVAINAYEKRIEKLEKEKLIMSEKIENTVKPKYTYEDMFELAIDFLSNPWKLWASKRLEDKRTVLKLTFADKLAYSLKTGLRTPKISLPFNVLQQIQGCKKEMARPERFELPTNWFEASYSIQLSYGRI